jgi:glucose-6-phosphate isomerase
MSVIRPKPPQDPIGYAAGGLVAADDADGRAGLEAALDRARRDVLDDEGCRQPERQLAAYNTGGGRRASDLFAILQAARHLRDTIDRVVIAGDDLGTLGGRAVFESCAHPRHNDLSRGGRGGRPRLLFVGGSLGNDGLQAILDLVAPWGGPPADDLLDAWGVLAVGSVDPDSFATASAKLLLERLADGGGAERLRERACVVAAEGSWLAERAAAWDCRVRFNAPPGLGTAAVFSPAGLLPAAIAGIDVVQLLAGAAAMHRRFREAPVAENPVLRHAAAVRAGAAAVGRDDVACRLVADVAQLAAVCGWHDRLEAVRRAGLDATAAEAGPCPPEPVETRLVVRVTVDAPRREPLPLPGPDACPAHGPVIRLPRVDEHAIGQMLQLLVVADRVLRRLAD